MKKYTLFILLILLCGAIALSAQSENTRRTDFFDNITHAISMDNGDIVVLSQLNDNTRPEIYIMNEDLVITSSYSIPWEVYAVNGMARGTDGSVFVIGWMGGCDYSFNEQSLIKIGLGIANDWQQTLEIDGYGRSLNFNTGLLRTGIDGGVWVDVGGSYGGFYDSLGNKVDGDTYYDWRNNYAAATSDDQYLYAAINTTPAQLLKMDYNFQVIDQRDWNVGDKIKAMTTDGNGNITVIGNDYDHIYAAEINSDFDFMHENLDVGIVEILNAEISYNDNPWAFYGTDYNVQNPRIIIQNFGTEPITSCEINAFYYNGCRIYCGEDLFLTFQWTYNNLLLPGERDTLNMGGMNICLDWDYDYGEPFCFYTTRPNSMVDKNQDNDRACASFETFLPIETLTPLKAKIENRAAVLTWETATETNNQGFEIQKSRDGVNWEKNAWIDGRGNVLTPHTYTYTDKNLLSGTTYYRFKQLDFDGKSTHSNIVNVQQRTTTNISIRPNPVKNTLHITNLENNSVEHINIFDQTGKQVISTKTVDNVIDVSYLSAGVYIIEIHIEGSVFHEKIVVE